MTTATAVPQPLRPRTLGAHGPAARTMKTPPASQCKARQQTPEPRDKPGMAHHRPWPGPRRTPTLRPTPWRGGPSPASPGLSRPLPSTARVLSAQARCPHSLPPPRVAATCAGAVSPHSTTPPPRARQRTQACCALHSTRRGEVRRRALARELVRRLLWRADMSRVRAVSRLLRAQRLALTSAVSQHRRWAGAGRGGAGSCASVRDRDSLWKACGPERGGAVGPP